MGEGLVYILSAAGSLLYRVGDNLVDELIKLIKRGKPTLKHFTTTFVKMRFLFLKTLRTSHPFNYSLISL